jgi:hypothetical protein
MYYLVFVRTIVFGAHVFLMFAYINVMVIPEMQFSKYQKELSIKAISDTTINVETELKKLDKTLNPS